MIKQITVQKGVFRWKQVCLFSIIYLTFLDLWISLMNGSVCSFDCGIKCMWATLILQLPCIGELVSVYCITDVKKILQFLLLYFIRILTNFPLYIVWIREKRGVIVYHFMLSREDDKDPFNGNAFDFLSKTIYHIYLCSVDTVTVKYTHD